MEAKAFHADPGRVLRGEARPYCIVIPPPNVTDRLHLGHALNNTLQDILARAHRMMGFETLWMPGTDHAGIATQAVVERRLRKDGKLKGALKEAFTRDAFVAEIQKFKDEYEAVITGQLKAMGCSCDWDRQRFTMDEICARAVREAFFRLFRDGLIYRGKRLVNWDPVLQTAVADDECYDEEVDAAFYYLRYPLVHPHGATTQKERRKGIFPPSDAVPVTWDELAARGYPGAENLPADEQAWVTVATTRPETYLGDTAVAVSPHDPRAKCLRGLCVELPLVGRVIPILEDAYVVLPKAMARNEEEEKDPKAEFATGFLKVTPAHDQNDYELYMRHKDTIDGATGKAGGGLCNIFAPDATISDKHGWSDVKDAHLFVGKKRDEARKLVVKEFEARGWLEGQRPYRHSVKHSDRSKAVVEPYLSDQWYVKVTDPKLAASANAALVKEQRTSGENGAFKPDHDGSMRFHPARYAKTYEQWHDGIRDWCISRQLWWGHRIPVWSKRMLRLPHEVGVSRNDIKNYDTRVAHDDAANPEDYPWSECVLQDAFDAENHWVSYVCPPADRPDISEALVKKGYTQDPDVLDTWFSSALWPMSTMGWPAPDDHDVTKGMLAAFNPTSTLCTAREIITLWVSRMVMFNRYFMGEGQGKGPVPYRDVFIHAVIQDGEGRKMSKSLGNGVDPLDIIATHGSDAMRFTLCQMTTNTQDVRMPVMKDANGKNTSPKFDAGRNFANKLWNAARFAMGILGSANDASAAGTGGGSLTLADRWMLSRLEASVRACDAALKDFQFSEYGQSLYDLLWRDFCDWYLEAIKPTAATNPAQRAVLAAALETILRLLHPVMPFVTEAIAERLTPATIGMARPAGITLSAARKSADGAGLLCTAGWPVIEASLHDPASEAAFERMRAMVTAIREVRAQHDVAPKRKVTLHAPTTIDFAGQDALIMSLAGVESIERGENVPPHAVAFAFESAAFKLSNLRDQASVDTGAEKERLAKKIADLDKSIATLEGRLGNPGYADRAPAAMVQQTRDQLAKAQSDRATAAATLEKLG